MRRLAWATCTPCCLLSTNKVPADIDIDEHCESIVAAARRATPCLERATGLRLELDDHVQDAPFACSIDHLALIDDKSALGATYYPVFSAKFSLFGDLVALYRSTDGTRVLNGSERRVPQEVFQRASECLVADGSSRWTARCWTSCHMTVRMPACERVRPLGSSVTSPFCKDPQSRRMTLYATRVWIA